jgi:hypothetical protein
VSLNRLSIVDTRPSATTRRPVGPDRITLRWESKKERERERECVWEREKEVECGRWGVTTGRTLLLNCQNIFPACITVCVSHLNVYSLPLNVPAPVPPAFMFPVCTYSPAIVPCDFSFPLRVKSCCTLAVPCKVRVLRKLRVNYCRWLYWRRIIVSRDSEIVKVLR